MEAPAKTATPRPKTLRWPKRSPRDPPVRRRAPRKRVYASTTHWIWLVVAFRDF
jgi:hypothetical protein